MPAVSMAEFNALPRAEAVARLLGCCSARAWAENIADARPFADMGELLRVASKAFRAIGTDDFRSGFEGHPRIGERPSAGHSVAHSKSEQAQVAGAQEDVLAQLATKNLEYESKFGFVYLVFAHGRSAEELLTILTDRLANDADTEWRNACTELQKITLHRLRQLVTDDRPAR
ncbi:2-oxo-4-hydroxy-4-carboxy-5-ureidoimidazoline decarboxylase [Hoyosella sp. YIM 151337]|uniref:2-oxo-4-hydroxy-4-carboxy-5-ureidoimidazoline decarboxylase n=1 Tax=Hoyosella sp. YIM 151337 TaxID=2992742 RepID=UPI0022359741|nr:2-oxo-4-hydroxy-4-carboxy-5-ureidoimidazoline decarboxylase [Hoyosella sp. YIM 151337]MCW4355944.1 2-oxo-4-hydroxy-4-carboxy-5-ureidoimidazoline decarboxylase [Hoyosella sp. YIM 151337]